MTPAPSPDPFGNTLKLIQISFYSIGSITAVLTYRAAKRGLLNSVNTEYQKRVMDRLQKLSDELYSEFDPTSEFYWVKAKPVDQAIAIINQRFNKHKEEILSSGRYPFGIPETKDMQRLQRLLGPIISDPFIPDEVRSAVVDLLDNRLEVLVSTYMEVLTRYSDDLAKGIRQPLMEPQSWAGIHNQILDQLYRKGCGVWQIQEEVQEIRGRIQDYFDSFNPHRQWWNGKRTQRRKKHLATAANTDKDGAEE